MVTRKIVAGEVSVDCRFEGDELVAVELPKRVPEKFSARELGALVRQLARFKWALPEASPFRRAVWEAVLAIPRGQTRTYGELARAVGAGGSARAVGTARARSLPA